MAVPPVTLDDLKAFVNLDPGDSSEDGELTAFLEAATDLVESAVGAMTPRQVTERVETNTTDLLLADGPVMSLTSVTSQPDGTAIDLTGLDVDLEGGVVHGVSYLMSYPTTSPAPYSGYSFVRSVFTVVYQAGRDPVPQPLLFATKVVAEQLFQTQRGPEGLQRFVSSGVADVASAPVYRGFAWPNRAQQAIAPYRRYTL